MLLCWEMLMKAKLWNDDDEDDRKNYINEKNKNKNNTSTSRLILIFHTTYHILHHPLALFSSLPLSLYINPLIPQSRLQNPYKSLHQSLYNPQ